MDRNSGVTINESGHGGKDDGSSKGNIFIASTVKKEGGDSRSHSMEAGDNGSGGSPFEGRELPHNVGAEHVNPFLGAETEEGYGGTSAIGATPSIETRREASEESADETENTDEKTAREVKNDPSDAEKAIEANRQKALDEIRLREYSDETLDKVREDCDNLSFRDCDGETITYSEALGRMTDDAGKLLDRLGDQGREISDEQKAAILSDMEKTILAQQAENERRAIGNHGIPHLYGNYERLRDIPDDVYEKAAEQVRQRHPESKATADDVRLGVLLSCAYHDEGYLADRTSGDPKTGKRDERMHGIDSAIAFENKHAPELTGVVDQAVLDETTMAIAEHNVMKGKAVAPLARNPESSPARVEMLERMGGKLPEDIGKEDVFAPANMDPNANFIRSALLLSDKAATDVDEKMADALRTPEAADILMHYYQFQNADGMTKAESEAVRTEMREKLSATLENNENLSPDQRERMRAAIERDVSARVERPDKRRLDSAGSYDFIIPTMGMAVSNDAVRYSLTEDGMIQAEVTISTRIDDPLYDQMFDGDRYARPQGDSTEGDKPGAEIAAKKVTGQLDDMGINRNTLPEDRTEVFTPILPEDDTEAIISTPQGIEVVPAGNITEYAVNTDGVEMLDHVSVKIESVSAEHPKAEISEAEKAMEARAEEIRALMLETEAQEEINKEALDALNSAIERDNVTRDDIAAYCAQIYDEVNGPQIDAIIAQLTEKDTLSQSDLRDIAQQCTQVPVRSYKERLRDALEEKK